jgi:hypothetical protein
VEVVSVDGLIGSLNVATTVVPMLTPVVAFVGDTGVTVGAGPARVVKLQE